MSSGTGCTDSLSRKAEKVSASKTRSAVTNSEEASQVPVHIRRQDRQPERATIAGGRPSTWGLLSVKEAAEERIATEVESCDEETEVEKEETSELECESLDAAMRFRPLNKDGGGRNSEKPSGKWNSLEER